MRLFPLALILVLALGPAPAKAGVEFGQNTLGNIFVEGELVAIPVHASGERLNWEVRDFFGMEVASGTAIVNGGAATIEPVVQGLGYFTLDVTVDGNSRSKDETQTVFAIVPRPKSASGESPFGVMTHFAKGWDTDIIPLIEKAGIRHVRDEQPWRKVEKTRGQYEFPPRLSGYISELAAHHIDPLIVLAFANPLYDDGQTPYSSSGLAGYAAYASSVVRHYGPAIRTVEIWNEYNGSFCDGPCRLDRPGYYASMLQQAYKSAKAADSSITVLGGAAVPIPLDYFRKLFEKGALASMDAVVIHPYRRQAEGVEQEIESLKALMAQHGVEKPIWATEFGDTADMRKSRDDVARYLVRMSTMLLSEKVERIYWYLLKDYQEFTGLGLVRDENDPLGRYAPTPAYVAYATLIHELDGLRFVRRESGDPRARIYVFADHDHEISVAWATMPGATYDIASDRPVQLVTMMGGEKSVAPQNGRVSIPLDQNPVYLVGGAAPLSRPAYSGSIIGASTVDDFSLEQGAKGWSYGAIVRPDGPLKVGDTVAEPLERLQPSETGDAWKFPGNPTLKIKANMMHPGRSHQIAAYAVRRWTSPAAGPVRVSGTVQVNDKKSDGVTFAILVNGRVAYVAGLGGESDTHKTDFDLPLALTSGATVDFAVGPGASGGINFDATNLSAVIVAAAP